MKKIISVILITSLLLNSWGGAGITLAQNNNQGIENELDRKNESVEESTEDFFDEKESMTKNEEDDVEAEEATDEVEPEEESDDPTEKVDAETEMKDEVDVGESENESKEAKENETSVENETSAESETTEDSSKEETIESTEETSESNDDAEVATLSEIEKDKEVKDDLYGDWWDYRNSKFSVYLDFSRTVDGEVLPDAIFSNIKNSKRLIKEAFTDGNGYFENHGYYDSGNLNLYRSDFNNLLSETIYTNFQYESEELNNVIPIKSNRGEALYYVERVQRVSGGNTDNVIEFNNNDAWIQLNGDHFTKVADNEYELCFYPTEFIPLLIQSITFKYVDPDTGEDLGEYTDTLENYYQYDYGGFNNYQYSRTYYGNDFQKTNFIVYGGSGNNGYIYKTWEDYDFDSSKNYIMTRKMHKGFKEQYSYDPDLDSDVDKSNPYTYLYKIIPGQSDIVELPLSDMEQEMAASYPNFVPRAQITTRNCTLTFGVYKTADVKYYNNDGSEQIKGNIFQAQHTQITNGRWPNSYPAPGVQYIPGFFVRGWNRLPNQDRNADETSTIRGQEITVDEAKNGIKLYAVGDIAETFRVVYDVNTPSNASPSWKTKNKLPEDLYVHDGNNNVYTMQSDPPTIVKSFWVYRSTDFVDVDGNVVLKLKELGEYIREDGQIYNYHGSNPYAQDLNTKEDWLAVFGDDKILNIKLNWEDIPEPASIKYKFKLKGTTNNSYLGSSSGYKDDNANIKILDDISDKLSNDYIVNLYKNKNSDYNSTLDPYITYEVDKIEYPENTFENNKIVRVDSEVTVYLAKKVRFTYYDSKGNDITATISSLAAKDNLSYVENDYGLYPVNPLSTSANQALGAIVPNKKVTGWRTSLTTTNQFNSFNSQYSINNRSGNRVSTYYGDKLYTIEKGSYKVKFETVASMSYTWPSNVDKSIQENIETGNSFTMPTVKGVPDNKYYHDGWTLNDTPITINSATINASMEALVNANNELVFKPVIKLLPSTGTLRLEVDPTKATINGYTEYINKDNFDSKKSSVTLTEIGSNEFKHWQLKGTSNKYNTVADFNWDGNDATLVAVFKGDSGVSIIVDNTKANYTGKSEYDDQTEFNSDKSSVGSKVSPLPTWKFIGFKESTTGIQYKADLSDFTWDGNDSVELVAEFERIIKNLTFEIDSTKATVDTSAKLTFDTNDVGSIVVPTMTVNTAYEFTKWVKKGTNTEVDPTAWDGVDDLTVVAEFRLLKTLKFDVTSGDIESVTGATEFNEKSASITIPTIVCKSGKKVAGWIINGNTGDVKTTAQLQTIIANWDKMSDMLIAPTFTNLKTLTFIISTDKATVPDGTRLVYDEESTNIQRPNFTTKAGFKFVRWKKGSTDIEDSNLMSDIASWTKTSDITYEAVFSDLKTFILYVDNNYLVTPIDPSSLEYDEDHLPPTTLPTITPKHGYNKAGDNGGWSTKPNGTKSDILSASDLQTIINDFRTKPSDQKQNVKLYYVFVEDDSIPKVKLNYDKAKGTLNGGPEVFIDKTEFDNTKDSVEMKPNSNFTFDGWKDSSTGNIYKSLSEFDWDGSSTVTLEAVFTAKATSNPNNGKGNNGGGGSGGGSSGGGGGGNDAGPTKPPAGFTPNTPMGPNQPNNIPPAQTEEERKERLDNPPSNKYIIANVDSGKSRESGSVSDNDSFINYYKWETSDSYVWRLIDMRYLEERVHYYKTSEESVVKSLNKPEIKYYNDGWALLDYKNTREWYHFNPSNIMDIGWFEQDGKFYFLQTEHNVTYGKMLTGEQVIGGITYVFGKNGVLESIKP